MLVIRDEQLAALAAQRRRELPTKIVRFLTDTLPGHARALGEPGLLAAVQAALERAALHGIVAEWDACRFCWLAAQHGPRFDDELEWARDILAFAELTPTTRVDALEHHHMQHIAPHA